MASRLLQPTAVNFSRNLPQSMVKLCLMNAKKSKDVVFGFLETFLGQKAELMENMLQVRRDVERLKLERKKLDFESELKSKDMMRLKDDIQQARVKTENMEEETIALKEKYAQLNYYAEEKENEVVAARKELFAVRESYEKSDLCLANQTNEELNVQNFVR